MKYKLKKDFGTYKAGEIIATLGLGDPYAVGITGRITILDKDWFEPVPDKPEKPKRWRAEDGQRYWFVDQNGTVDYLRDDRYDLDGELYELGNYFRTEAQAEAVARAVRALFEYIQDPAEDVGIEDLDTPAITAYKAVRDDI
ncbi:MAG TPA: hypothetical protein VNX65_02260 [Patescibacteria group bacterium]|jgi:hypothetical protein|nr:hypothetical protein [Patescibacteria group bacterium]